MGPDEFHDGSPEFSNARPQTTTPIPTIMAVWGTVPGARGTRFVVRDASRRTHDATWLSPEEIARWGDISRRMYVPFHDDGIIQPVRGLRKTA